MATVVEVRGFKVLEGGSLSSLWWLTGAVSIRQSRGGTDAG
jgi:hypothetical protein